MDTTLVKGLTVLEALAKSRAPRGVSDLARELDLTKSNVHRTLQTLIAAGYVRAGERPGTYACSLKLFELASAVIARVDVRQCAEPVMTALADTTRETVHLSVLDPGGVSPEVIYLHKIESPEPVRAYSAIGGRAPAHCVASGKALLAYQGDAYVDDLPAKLPGFTPRSLTSRAGLRTEIVAIRRRGYAVNQGEWRASVCGLAAIILDAGRHPVAAVGISGPVERLRPTVLRRHRDVVIDAAREISGALGCTEYTPVRELVGART